MKKALLLLLAVIFILSFTACSSTKEAEQSKVTEGSSAEATTPVVDENLLTVDINVPASWFDEENPATDVLTQEQKDNGFKSAKVNDDGSVTYTIGKSDFNKYKEELKSSTVDTLKSISTEYPCIKSVEFTDNFSEITLKVNKSEYENGLNSLSIPVAGFSANMYQTYTNEPVKSEIKVVDMDTNETIEEATYPTDN